MDELFDWDTGESQAERSGVEKQDAARHLRDAAGAHMGFMAKCEIVRSSHSPSGKRSLTAFGGKQHRIHVAEGRENMGRECQCQCQKNM